MMTNKEIRSYGTELRVATTEQGKTLTGYAAAFNSLSEDLGGFVEKIAPNAFTRTLTDSPDVLAYFNHNSDYVLGRTTSSTLTLGVDDKGLRFTLLLPDTDYGNNLATSINRGDITGCSFGFQCLKDSWDATSTPPVRTLEDVNLIEVTVTPCPAYPDTSVALRSAKQILGDNMLCTCPCAQCRAGACGICSTPSCAFIGCKCPDAAETNSRAKTPTKMVDGHELKADDFIIAINADDPETWHLPWHFPTEAETISHLRDALARFDQLKDIPQDVLDAAKAKLDELAKKYGIDVNKNDDVMRNKARQLALRLRMTK